jgi:hypothetical protein
VGLFSKDKPEPKPGKFVQNLEDQIDGFARTLAGIAPQRDQVAYDLADRQGSEAAQRNAANEFQAAESELRRLADPVIRLDAEPEAITAAEKRFRAARQALEKANRDLQACPHTEDSLQERTRRLNASEADLREAAHAAKRRVAAYKYLAACLALRDCAQDPNLPRAVDFPDGVLSIEENDQHAGENRLTRTILHDHILRAFAENFPEILQAIAAETGLLGDGEVFNLTRIVRQHEDLRQRSNHAYPPPRWKPGAFSVWHI